MSEITAKKNKNPFSKVGKFLKEVKAELKKVVWPTKKQVINNSLIVLATVLIIGVVIWILDAIFQLGIFQFLK